MDPRYLTHLADAQMIMECVRLIRQLIQTDEMKTIGLSELVPGPLVVDLGNTLEVHVRTACIPHGIPLVLLQCCREHFLV